MGEPTPEEHALYLEERKILIDAARESSRTFDKAVLTFGSAVFGFSIAFLKDVAPKPTADSIIWLRGSWLSFSLGLLAILLSFLFSHRACLFEIGLSEAALGKKNSKPRTNPWGIATDCCNILCIIFLFTGLLCWSNFASINLCYGETPMDKVVKPSEKKGYVPPSRPVKPPSQNPSPLPRPTPQK